MSIRKTELGIEEVKALRLQRRWWRSATGACVICITVTCLLNLRNSANQLLEDGPAHDEFVSQLNLQLTGHILPRREVVAAGTAAPAVSTVNTATLIDHGKVDPMPQCIAEGRATALTRFRQQTVAEYQDTMQKIINDLTAIRQAEGAKTGGGLPANAVALLLVNRVQESIDQQSLENRGWQVAEGAPGKNE
jgi:hypothetical protein